MDFVAIDFEASCLPRHGRSFPIEVAISGAEGTRSWLIAPHATWQGWDWTDEAARLHGITRDDLERHGQAPSLVLAELTQAIAGRRVFADSSLDSEWLALLAKGADNKAHDRIEHAGALLDELGAAAVEIETARHFADRYCQARHRAGADARWLWYLLARLQDIASARTTRLKAA
jgi:hypothetical protein